MREFAEKTPSAVRDAVVATRPRPAVPVLADRVHRKLGNAAAQRLTGAVPDIVHEALAAPGRPLDPAIRGLIKRRFGHDFSEVRVHTGGLAARSAEAVAAQAYTVGSDVVFGAGRYAPSTRDGQSLIAHELAHVRDQRSSGPGLQRQPLWPEAEETIPIELRSSADVARMTDDALADRHDHILRVLGRFTMSTPETALLEREAARIGVELARRRALAEGRTFTEEAVNRMKAYFTANAAKPAKPDVTPLPPPPPGGWQDVCIVALNKAMKIVTSKPTLPTTPKTIEKTMEKIAGSGHSGVAREVWFLNRRGRRTTGAARPETLEAGIWDTVLSLAAGDPGWSVFTMSILDGFHSVTLTLDATDPQAPHLYWSNQWSTKGGWKEYTRSELDAEVTRLVQNWWDEQAEGKKHNTVVRIWRVRATPEP